MFKLETNKINGVSYQQGTLTCRIHGTTIYINSFDVELPIASGLYTDFCDSTNTAYTTLANFITAWNTLFSGTQSASSGGISTSSVILVQPIDETGAIIKGGGTSITAEYFSPDDFSVAYTSASTVTITGLPFTLQQGVNIVAVKVRNTSTNITITYVNGSAGYAFAYSSGVVTAYLNGTAASIFTANDMYELGINAQKKAYDPTTDSNKISEVAPLSIQYVPDSLIDTTNVAAGTSYLPSATGMSMDGFKDLSFTGKIIEGDAVTDSFQVEVTNDEDPATADWVVSYGFRVDTNAMVNIITTGGAAGTYTFALDFDNFNFSYFRIKLITGDSTNTIVIKARRKAL